MRGGPRHERGSTGRAVWASVTAPADGALPGITHEYAEFRERSDGACGLGLAVVEEASESGDWDYFREKLVNAKSKSKSVCYIIDVGSIVTF